MRDKRRTLVEGVKPPMPPLDPAIEHEFVFGKKPPQPAPHAPSNQPIARTQFSSKLRINYAEALKRASLERQLKKIYPNRLQEILEEALEPWLKNNGYLP